MIFEKKTFIDASVSSLSPGHDLTVVDLGSHYFLVNGAQQSIKKFPAVTAKNVVEFVGFHGNCHKS